MLNNIIRLTRHLKYLRLRKPLFFGRVLLNYCKFFCGRRVGRSVDILINYDCQCDCQHCLTGINLRTRPKELSLNEWKDAIRSLAGAGFLHYNFSGGEPLLSDKTYSLIEYLHKKSFLTSINTNGLLLTRQNLVKLKKAGLDAIQVSIDHSDAATHDSFRNYPGIYEQALKGAQEALGMGFAVSVNSLVTKERIKEGDVLKLYSIVKKMGLIYQLEIPCCAGKYAGKSDELLNAQEEKVYWGYIEKHDMRNDNFSTYWKTGCDAGSEKITITPDGEVIPCSVIQISFGNIKEERFCDIWKRWQE